MFELTGGGWVLCLAAADTVATLALVLLIERRARRQAVALEDARHELEIGLAFLDSRLRARRAPADKLPPIYDEGA